MRKMKLDIDKLAVESFDVAEDTDARGTIAGNQGTRFCTAFTCGETCAGETCEATCTGTCYTAPNCQQIC